MTLGTHETRCVSPRPRRTILRVAAYHPSVAARGRRPRKLIASLHERYSVSSCTSHFTNALRCRWSMPAPESWSPEPVPRRAARSVDACPWCASTKSSRVASLGPLLEISSARRVRATRVSRARHTGVSGAFFARLYRSQAAARPRPDRSRRRAAVTSSTRLDGAVAWTRPPRLAHHRRGDPTRSTSGGLAGHVAATRAVPSVVGRGAPARSSASGQLVGCVHPRFRTRPGASGIP